MDPYLTYVAYRAGPFLVIIEKDARDPTSYQLRIAKFISLDDRDNLGYWAAPYLAQAMQGAADFYAAAMEESRQQLEADDLPASRDAESSRNP